MNFLINWNNSNSLKNKLSIILGSNFQEINGENYLSIDTNFYKTYESVNELIVTIGDLVNTETIKESINTNSFQNIHNNFNSLKGFYYLIRYLKKENTLFVYSSFLGILPIYFYEINRKIYISSSIGLIKYHSNIKFTINKNYILEKILFNYPLFSDTYYNEVRLLPANSYIRISTSGMDIFSVEDIVDKIEYPSKISVKNSIENMSDYFINSIKHYYPDEKFLVSFTGGFDGRSIVSCALYHKKNISTFSFSAQGANDIEIPLKNSKQIGIDFYPIYLNEPEYYKIDFQNCAHDLIEMTMGLDNYIYSQFLYSAKQLSKYFKYQLNGMFGSELLRAIHIGGALTSFELVNYFRNIRNRDNIWINGIKNSPKLFCLNKNIFINEINTTIQKLYNHKTTVINQKNHINKEFYRYIFNETFRKVFGTHIFSQMNYQIIRSPFLDPDFVITMLGQPIAGLNNPFFTENPVNRFKGQLLYKSIIKKTSKVIYRQETGKGYRPADLGNILGIMKISYKYIQKKYRRPTPDLNNLGILSGLHNLKNDTDTSFSSEFFNASWYYEKKQSILKCTNENERDLLSTIMAFKYLFLKEENNE